ncbi:MAG: FAD:protein FMN transferase [Candidatus Competibacterales bacterium]
MTTAFNPTRRRLGRGLLGLALAPGLGVGGCSRPPQTTLLTGTTMGTYYGIQLPRGLGPLDRQTLQYRIEGILGEVIKAMSTYAPQAEIVRFNQLASTQWVPVSAAFSTVVTRAQAMAVLTGGAFDVTVAPAVDLWGFGPAGGRGEIPRPQAIATTRATVGYQHLETTPLRLRKARVDVGIDLSGIAKGYAVDRIAAELDAAGIDDYLVDIGGELRLQGHNGDGQPWRIAVERPVDANPTPLRIMALTGAAIATSGDYRHYFERGGIRYAHAIDPRTGCPVNHHLASVTVVAEGCMDADALATGLFVLGPERGFALAEAEGIAALFVAGDTSRRRFEQRPTGAFDALG